MNKIKPVGWRGESGRHSLARRGIRSSGRIRKKESESIRLEKIHMMGAIYAVRLRKRYELKFPEEFTYYGNLKYPELFGFFIDGEVDLDDANRNIRRYEVTGRISNLDKETFISGIYDYLVSINAKTIEEVNNVFNKNKWKYHGENRWLI